MRRPVKVAIALDGFLAWRVVVSVPNGRGRNDGRCVCKSCEGLPVVARLRTSTGTTLHALWRHVLVTRRDAFARLPTYPQLESPIQEPPGFISCEEIQAASAASTSPRCAIRHIFRMQSRLCRLEL